MRAVILCAGFGTRLGDLTQECPKPLLKIGSQSILERQILSLKKIGVKNIYINLHYLAEQIVKKIGDGSRLGVEVEYLHEEIPSGTAGGVKIFEKFFNKGEDFFVLYGDIVTNENLERLSKFHKKNGAALSFYVHEREGSNSLVELDENGLVSNFLERPSLAERGNFKRSKEKKSYVNSGIYILNEDVLKFIPEKISCDFPKDIFPILLKEKSLFAIPIIGERVAIDSSERLALANNIFKESDL